MARAVLGYWLLADAVLEVHFFKLCKKYQGSGFQEVVVDSRKNCSGENCHLDVGQTNSLHFRVNRHLTKISWLRDCKFFLLHISWFIIRSDI